MSILLVLFCIAGAYFAAIRIHEEREKRQKLNEQNEFTIEDDAMEEYISSSRLRHNMNCVASLSYADLPEISTRKGVKPVRKKMKSYAKIYLPQLIRFTKVHFPMEDTNPVKGGSSRSRNGTQYLKFGMIDR